MSREADQAARVKREEFRRRAIRAGREGLCLAGVVAAAVGLFALDWRWALVALGTFAALASLIGIANDRGS